MASKFIKSIPNTLTLIRLGLIPVFMLFMRDPSPWMVSVATAIFILATITDLLDGFVARFFRAETDFGKLVDPLADKILVMTALVMLVSLTSEPTGEHWVPPWMVVVILAREFWITGLRGVAAARGQVIAASDGGKLKTLLQMLAIVFLLMHDQTISVSDTTLKAQLLGLYLLFISILVSLWSAYEYSMKVFAWDQREAYVEEEAVLAPLEDLSGKDQLAKAERDGDKD